MKKYKVIALHFTTDCNLNCSFCYKKDKPKDPKPFSFFIDLVPNMAKLTEQIAIGGGEPFLYPDFIKEMGKECKKHGLIMNVTSHGGLIPYIEDDVFENIRMISLSYDSEKIKNEEDRKRYWKNVKILKDKGMEVGMNLLVEELGKPFVKLVYDAFRIGRIDRVFALCKKNFKAPDILKHKSEYLALTTMFKHFYVDDLTSKIITEGKLRNWKKPCHYGNGLLSISEQGIVTGCSFDKKGVLLNKPDDLLQEFKFKERYNCPYLVR